MKQKGVEEGPAWWHIGFLYGCFKWTRSAAVYASNLIIQWSITASADELPQTSQLFMLALFACDANVCMSWDSHGWYMSGGARSAVYASNLIIQYKG